MNYYPNETLDKWYKSWIFVQIWNYKFTSKGYDCGRRPSPTLIRVSGFKNIVGPNLVRSKTSCAPGSGPLGKGGLHE